MAINAYNPTPEELGRKRFPDNKAFRKTLSNTANDILAQFQDLLASNYPTDFSTNLNIFNRTMAREIARINLSINAINDDKDYTLTRPQYLQQILGERFFLGSRIAPMGYNDESYRNYLLSIKSANLKGSKKSTLEALASEFTGQTVNIKELYLEARKSFSSIGVNKANKMIVQVLIDNLLQPGQNVNVLKDNLDFFINLVRPAHVLYDTELIWTDQIDVNKVIDVIFGDTGGGCIPAYQYVPFDGDERTILALVVRVVEPGPQNIMGFVEAVHNADYLFYLDDATKVITEPGYEGTKIYDINGRQITLNGLEVGSYVTISYQEMPGSFQFWNYPSEILTTPYSQFYRDIYRRPLFQETVKKYMDAQGRFPLQIKTTPTTVCDRWVQDVLQPLYEDLRGNCKSGREWTTSESNYLRKHKGFPKLYWPFPSDEVYDPALLGSDFVQFMEHYPLTDGSSSPAIPADISVAIDGTALTGSISSIDSSSGRVYLNDTTSYWDPILGQYPVNGQELTFNYKYLDGTTNYTATTQTVFGVSYWQLNKIPILKGDSSGTLADSSNVTVFVDGTVIPNAIIGFEPLLGHVTLSPYSDFWTSSALGRLPMAADGTNGDVFKFSYTWGENYDYGLLFDDPARYLDTHAGSSDPYGMLFDGGEGTQPIPAEDPLEIGYRYRMYLLHHSSVLNSPGTLNLNEYQKPGNRASIANQMAVLNHYNKVFSPEFLYDTDPLPDPLNDLYLSKPGLDPVLKLNAGTPTFQQTFTYQPHLIYQKKLQDIRKNHKLLMYSDLLLKEFRTGSDEVKLSSICDSNRVSFKFSYKETIPPIRECSPWILFDTVETEDVSLSIPSEYMSVPNLREPGKLLRQNFILRGVEPTGAALFSYIFTTPSESMPTTTFQLPATYKFFLNDYWVDFPCFGPDPLGGPDRFIEDFYGFPATASDIICTVNGQSHTVTGLNPITGVVTIADYDVTEKIGEIFTLTAQNIEECEILLPGYITSPENAEFTIIHGSSQFIYKDFKVNGQHVTWYFSELKGILQAGDQIRVSYTVIPVNAEIEFSYHIRNSAVIKMVDRDMSRIMDDKYVFGGLCYDQEGVELNVMLNEYYSFLDDDSDGIKISFFNKDTLTIEDHIFSGPVFESYKAVEDEIGVPENFPNALVRIANPLSLNNPLNYAADYGFLNDSLVRFRKKTYQELLPDRSFRTMKLVEMLPV